MANALGIDLGEVYRTVEAVKTSRAARGATEKAAAQTANVNALATQAAGGDQTAMAGLIALDPTRAKAITDAYTALDEAGRTAKRAEIDQLGQLAAGILSAPDPKAVYATVLSSLPPEVAATFPQEYDENFIRFQLGQATEADKIFDAIDGDRTYTRDRADKLADDERDQAQAIELEGIKSDNAIRETVAKEEAEGTGGVDSTASNAIYRQAAGLFDSTMTPSGEFVFNDPTARTKVAEIAALAEKKMTGPNAAPSIAIALQQAAEELGYEIAGVNRRANNVLANGGDPAATGPANDPFNLGL